MNTLGHTSKRLSREAWIDREIISHDALRHIAVFQACHVIIIILLPADQRMGIFSVGDYDGGVVFDVYIISDVNWTPQMLLANWVPI